MLYVAWPTSSPTLGIWRIGATENNTGCGRWKTTTASYRTNPRLAFTMMFKQCSPSPVPVRGILQQVLHLHLGPLSGSVAIYILVLTAFHHHHSLYYYLPRGKAMYISTEQGPFPPSARFRALCSGSVLPASSVLGIVSCFY